jgi:SecD/SecF fusion protein
LLILFLFGGETIRGFSFAMLIGVIIGTYSSICIGTPIVIDFGAKTIQPSNGATKVTTTKTATANV